MWLRHLKIGLLLIVIASFLGCTHNYSPKPFPIKPGLVPDLNINNSVHIVNAQDEGANNVFYRVGGSKWVGDLGDWTQNAVELLKFEMKKKDITISEDANKVLQLTVTEGRLDSEFAGIRCVVKLKVKAGNGYTQIYEGNHRNSSPFAEQARYHAGAGAVTKAVTELLNDKKITEYLEN